MAVRLDAPTGTWQRQDKPSGISGFIWKDTTNNIFLDTTACVWLDQEIDLIEKLSRPTGIIVKQSAVA